MTTPDNGDASWMRAQEHEFLATLPQGNCQCLDPDCPAGHGRVACPNQGTRTLWRIDQEDHDGTLMCADCAADDAFLCVLFTDVEE